MDGRKKEEKWMNEMKNEWLKRGKGKRRKEKDG